MSAHLSRPTSDPALAPVIRTATEPLEVSQLRALLDAQHYLRTRVFRGTGSLPITRQAGR